MVELFLKKQGNNQFSLSSVNVSFYPAYNFTVKLLPDDKNYHI